MIIGLGHKSQSGKDTIANMLIIEWGYHRIGFADKLKEGCGVLFSLTDQQKYGEEKKVVDPYWNMTPSEIFQIVGTELFRDQFDKDFWLKAAIKGVNEGDRVVFSDVRFPNEAEAIKKLGGVLIRVDRENRGSTGRSAQHASETALDDYTGWDYILDNNAEDDTLSDATTAALRFRRTELYAGLSTIMRDLSIFPRPDIVERKSFIESLQFPALVNAQIK